MSFVAHNSHMKVFENFKKTDSVVVIEIAMGVFFAIMAVRLMSVIFGRQSLGTVFGAENAEDLENFGGRRRARRTEKVIARRQTSASNKAAKMKAAREEGKRLGSARRIADQPEEEIPEPEEMPSDEDYGYALEMAEHFNSLTQEDINSMDDAEYAEYVEYAQMVGNS